MLDDLRDKLKDEKHDSFESLVNTNNINDLQLKRATIGLKFISSMPLLMINGIGWQMINDHRYFWDSKKRKTEHCILQYTIAGEGEIVVNSEEHRLKKGDAFLISIPGDESYRLPKDSDFWEVLYIEFSKEAEVFFNKITGTEGKIINLRDDSRFLEFAWNVYKEVLDDKIDTIYKCSSYGYQLIMELLNEFTDKVITEEQDKAVMACKLYIDKNYYKIIGLDDLTDIAKLSKYHLSRKFKEQMGITPGNYLIKVRLEKAMELILSSEESIDEIAKSVGFSCGNYFSKVFRKYVELSPSQFKNNSEEYSINKIVFDNNFKKV